MNQIHLLTRTHQSAYHGGGTSALQAVLSHWGKHVTEADLMELMHIDPADGICPKDIVRVARALGFDAELKENLTLHEVKRRTANGDPAIALGHVWHSQTQNGLTFADARNGGQYIVILGVDKDHVYFHDPAVRMSKAFVPRKTFEEHWRQTMGGGRVNNSELILLGIFVRGQKSAEKPAAKLPKPDFEKLGSLNLIITQFRGGFLPYDILNELTAIWASEVVRPDAFIFLRKDKEGNLSAMQGSQLEDDGDMTAVNAVISVIAKRRIKSLRTYRSSIERAISAITKGDFGLPASQIRRIAQKLPPDHSAIILLVENVWERKFKDTAKRHRGTVISQKLVTPQELAAEAGKLLR